MSLNYKFIKVNKTLLNKKLHFDTYINLFLIQNYTSKAFTVP